MGAYGVSREVAAMVAKCAVLETALTAELVRADDIRHAWRNSSDTPEGHAGFYRVCSGLVGQNGATR